jgi:hypothetical protein
VALFACNETYQIIQPTSANVPPTAGFTVDDTNPLVGATLLTFTASATDPDGQPLTYSWNLGDGTVKPGPIVTHTYQAPGLFTVILTVTDSGGLATSVSAQVNARRLAGVWFSRARAWYFEIAHVGPNITGRLLGFREVSLPEPIPLFGVVRHPRTVAFDVPGGISFAGAADSTVGQIVGTLNEGSRRYGEVLVRQQ